MGIDRAFQRGAASAAVVFSAPGGTAARPARAFSQHHAAPAAQPQSQTFCRRCSPRSLRPLSTLAQASSQPQPSGERPNDMAPAATRRPVWLLLPNLIGYLRLALLLLAWAAAVRWQAPALAGVLFVASVILDAVDGWVARTLGQVSEFGAWLDVFIDNATRGLLWALALDGSSPLALSSSSGAGALLGALQLPGLYLVPVLLEMSTFMATHRRGGAAWKEGCFKDAPAWVQWCMASGFKTPQGSFILAGLFGTPLWLWSLRSFPSLQQLVPGQLQLLATCALLCGRGLAAAVELWVLQRHFGDILAADADAMARRK